MPDNEKFDAIKRRLAAIALALVATYGLNFIGMLHPFERYILDWELANGPQPGSKHIAVVMITDSEYDSIFGGQSPLNPIKLRDLVAAIAAQNPEVIAVDIDTSDRSFESFSPRFNGPEGEAIPIVWEREVDASSITDTSDFRPLDVLGSRDPNLNRYSGIPALLDDPLDKTTRYYVRCIKTKDKNGDVPSFVYAVKNYRYLPDPNQRLCADRADSRAYFIWFTSKETGIDMTTATTVLEAKAKKRNLSILNKHIVILGGAYRDYDRHFTPIGNQVGTIVLANALQTELEGPHVPVPPPWELFIFEALAATLLVLGLHMLALSPLLLLLGGSTLTVVLTLLFSYFSYNSLFGVVVFGPTLLAVLLFEIYEYVRVGSILQASRFNDNSPKGELPR